MKSGRIESILAGDFRHFVMDFFRFSGLILVFLALTSSSGFGQENKQTKPMTASAARGGAPANLKCVADLPQRLAKFRRVPMPLRTSGLSIREQHLVGQLVEA